MSWQLSEMGYVVLKEENEKDYLTFDMPCNIKHNAFSILLGLPSDFKELQFQIITCLRRNYLEEQHVTIRNVMKHECMSNI